ncbi:facilitated trehalose transporter Tret1 [Nasonia vitripennis]|uniref:Major facilitator superfamily (MFS) profile domain-containing protein n=1 Tax=Nasonia vitripennis TaxID=7425 RepID=A0A7M7LJF8_NASVI|nr:facilitated trehalose transporter Tret1 [Nasonia vitripennis]
MVQVASKTSSLRKFFPQLVAGFGVTMVLVQLGISSGWSSPYLARLTAPDSPLPLTLDEASWVASLLNLGRFAGAIIGAMSVNYLGSKRAMFMTLIPISMCWLLTILAKSASWLYAARFFGGMGLGMTYSSFPLYLGEVALPEIRGSLVSLAACGGTFGVLLGSVAGSYLDLEVSAGIYLAPCLALMVLFAWLPESPHHLVKIGEFEEAKKSVEFYRAGCQVEEEFDAVKKFVSNASTETFSEKLAEFRQPALIRATILIIVLWAFMQICGFNSVLFYMEIILKQGQSHLIEAKVVVMYVSASAVLASVVSIIMIDRCGRRMLLIISSLGVTLSMAGLGTHFHLIESGYDVTDLQWLPVASLFLFDISFFVGLMCVPSAVLSELFPTNVKCIAACFASLAGAIFAFIATKSYQPLIELIGQSNVFFMHAVLTVLIVPYALICMPETKGKTLQQIQDDLVKR